MKIHVTQQDIDDGERKCPNGCAVALALRRAFPHKAWIGVWFGSRPHADVNERRLYLPEAVEKFAREFDAGKPVKPFSFDVPPLSKWENAP